MKRVAILITMLMVIGFLILGCSTASKNTQESTSDIKGSQNETVQGNSIKIKFASFLPSDHPQSVAIKERFKKEVEEKSEGSIQVEIFDNNVLGDEQAIAQGVEIGTVEMALTGITQGEKFPRLRVLEMPFLFNDTEHALKVLEDEKIMEQITDGLSEFGSMPIAYSQNGFRVISNSKRPINSSEDMHDIKLRVPTDNFFIKIFETMDAPTVTMPFTEVFSALQQGVIDGLENPPLTIYTSKFHEVQDFVSVTNHIFSPAIYYINTEFYNKLSENQQKIITEAAISSANHASDLSIEMEAEIFEKFEAEGIEVNYPDIKPFQEKVQLIYEEEYQAMPELKEIVEQIKAKQK